MASSRELETSAKKGNIVKRMLLTGMSGTGTSTVTSELASRGYKAVDADCDEFSEWAEVSDDAETPGTPVEPGRDCVARRPSSRTLVH